MDLAAKFIAEYACTECGELLDVEGMLFPELLLPCDECGVKTIFKAVKVVQISELGYSIEDQL